MSLYRGLGNASRVAGTLGNLAGATNLLLDYNDMQEGIISSSRFNYRASSYLVSLGVGAYYGTAGMYVGGVAYMGEYLYDAAKSIYWSWEQKLQSLPYTMMNPVFW